MMDEEVKNEKNQEKLENEEPEPTLEELNMILSSLEKQKSAAVENEDYDAAKIFKGQIETLKKQILAKNA